MSGSWIVSQEPWEVEVTHDGQTAQVMLRELTAGEDAQLDDMLSVDEAGDPQLRLGSRKLQEVAMSIVRWNLPDLPESPQAALIGQLPTSVYAQITKAVDRGRPGNPTTPEPEPTPPGAKTSESDVSDS
jgi:hypothetical protein